jgi:hypothetical protein
MGCPPHEWEWDGNALRVCRQCGAVDLESARFRAAAVEAVQGAGVKIIDVRRPDR